MHIGINEDALAAFAGTGEATELISSLPPDNDGVLDDLDTVAELLREAAAAKVFALHALPDRVTTSAVQSLDVTITDDGNTYSIDLAARVVWTISETESAVWLHSFGDGNYTSAWFDTDATESTAKQIIRYMAEQVAGHLNGELFAQQAAWTAMVSPLEAHVLVVEHKHGHEITVHASGDDAVAYFVNGNTDQQDRTEEWFDPADPVTSILADSADLTMWSGKFTLPNDFAAPR